MKLRRKIYYMWPAHIRSGKMALLEPKKLTREMVRVRITLAPRKR